MKEMLETIVKYLVNNPDQGEKVLPDIIKELKSCIIYCDHNGIELKIHNRKNLICQIFRHLENTSKKSRSQGRTLKENQNIFELSENEISAYQNACDTTKAVLRKKHSIK